MVDLSQAMGFSAQFDPDRLAFIFGAGVLSIGSEEIHFDDLAPVLLNAESNGPDLLGRKYPRVEKEEDRDLLEAQKIRFELSVLAPGNLGEEAIKTRGRYQSSLFGDEISYPAVVEVLQGRGLFLLQKAAPPYEHLEDAVLVIADARQRLLIPPGYGYTEINPGDKPLVLMSCLSSLLQPVEGPYLRHKGACYYATKAEQTILFVPNEAYSNIPPLRVISANDLPDFAKSGQGLYSSMISDPGRLDALSHPERHPKLFEGVLDSAHMMRGLLL